MSWSWAEKNAQNIDDSQFRQTEAEDFWISGKKLKIGATFLV